MVQGWTVFLARRGQHGLTLTSSLKNGAAHYFKLLSNLWFANAFQSLSAAPGALPAIRSNVSQITLGTSCRQTDRNTHFKQNSRRNRSFHVSIKRLLKCRHYKPPGLELVSNSMERCVARFVRAACMVLLACSCALLGHAQCGFTSTPASVVRWYRSQGWQTPGVDDAKSIRPIVGRTLDGRPLPWPEGVTVSMIEHEDNYRVHFPGAIFDQHGVRRKMLPATMGLKWLYRWEISGRPYAYSYFLLPDDVACFYTVDLVGDRGDGKFLLMLSPGHAMSREIPSIPKWGIKPKS